MKTITIDAKETIYHEVTLTLSDEEMKDLISELNSPDVDDVVGELCDHRTASDREFEYWNHTVKVENG